MAYKMVIHNKANIQIMLKPHKLTKKVILDDLT
uniref:Transposase n=1 Tax=Meloidogyne hapla TaxID=6305 RepID=A0A1I8B627_MELHA